MNKLLSFLSGALLISVSVLCTLCAVISAFSLEADIAFLFRAVIVAAVIVSLLCTLLRAYGLIICAPLLLAAIYYFRNAVAAGFEAVLRVLTFEYSSWFPVPVLFEGAKASPAEISLFFSALGAALALLLGISVCIRRSVPLTLLFTLPIAALSLVFENLPPDPIYLIGLMAVYLVMLYAGSLGDRKSRGASAFPAIVLTVALMGLAYLAAGPGGHERGAFVATLDQRITGIATQLNPRKFSRSAGWPAFIAGSWRFDIHNVEIADAGARNITGQALLEIEADMVGTYYLHGYSMTRFDGRNWSDNANSLSIGQDVFSRSLPFLLVTQNSELPQYTSMTVRRSGDNTGLVYLPYYSDATALREPDEYSVSFVDMQSKILNYGASGIELHGMFDYYNEAMLPYYTQIDSSTAQALRELAAAGGIIQDNSYGKTAGRARLADEVAAFVSSSAVYTLSPPVTPADEDFAIYFLTQSKRGYCIHFATAATLMLRALDVPARFASGFVVTVPENGAAVTVTDGQAHAWVEVYYEDIGWIPLEATPPDADAGIPAGFEYYPALGGVEEAMAQFGDRGETDNDAEAPWDTVPSQSSAPQERIAQPDGPESSKAGTNDVLYAAAICVAVCLLLILRWHIILMLRKKKFRDHDTNASTLYAWRYILRLHGKRRTPPAEIEELALKARFSQHMLTEDERDTVTGYAVEYARMRRNNSSAPKRLVMRYIRALY